MPLDHPRGCLSLSKCLDAPLLYYFNRLFGINYVGGENKGCQAFSPAC